MSELEWQDPFAMESQLTEEERLVQKTARDYAEAKLAPRVRDAFRHERTAPEIIREMGALGFPGCTLSPDYGGAGLRYVAYGLIAREVERVDSGYRSMLSVQSYRFEPHRRHRLDRDVAYLHQCG
jgi:glutaryl-CoA dehydrogenase